MKKGMKISDYYQLAHVLHGLGTRQLSEIKSDKWNAHYRDECIRSIQGIIESQFIPCEGEDPAINDWISKLENLLMQSKIEQQLFDFKIGLHDVSINPAFNQKCFSKIIKTLTAMANTQKQSTGYVIVGIADNEADARHFSTVYKAHNREFNGFSITGVQEEIRLKYKNADDYFMRIKNLIKREPIDSNTQSEILRRIRLVNYFDKLLLVFTLSSENAPIAYDNKFYERHATSVEEIIGATGLADLFSRFK